MTERPEPIRRKWWPLLNSPLVLLVISAVVIAGGWKLFDNHQEAMKDRAARRVELGKLLVEFERRVAVMSDADAKLNDLIAHPPNITSGPNMSAKDGAVVIRRMKASDDVSAAEWDALNGGGPYVPSDPNYKGVSFVMIAMQMQNAAGVPDYRMGGLRALKLLEVSPPFTWLFVRAQLPVLRKMAQGTDILFVSQALPLARGEQLSPGQERLLAIPQVSPGQLAELQRENDDLMKKVGDEVFAGGKP
jgi:hypothetical protein